jgi:hypothetical protein
VGPWAAVGGGQRQTAGGGKGMAGCRHGNVRPRPAHSRAPHAPPVLDHHLCCTEYESALSRDLANIFIYTDTDIDIQLNYYELIFSHTILFYFSFKIIKSKK